MYRCFPFAVNNTPEKDWLFSILRQTQSSQAQDEWYLEYLLNKSGSGIIILYDTRLCPSMKSNRDTEWNIELWPHPPAHHIILIFYDHWWMHLMSWWPGGFVLAGCQCVISYLIPRPSPIYSDHMLPILGTLDKHQTHSIIHRIQSTHPSQRGKKYKIIIRCTLLIDKAKYSKRFLGRHLYQFNIAPDFYWAILNSTL